MNRKLKTVESGPPATKEAKAAFGINELLHFSRLITIGELSACFAHEVTNPLTLIRGHLRFMEEKLSPNDPLRANFEVIDRASRRIEEMARHMLDFSKKRSRRIAHCDMAEIVSDALLFVQPYVQNEFIDVRVELDSEIPAVSVDRWQMVQAIVNILQNAADAMSHVKRRVLSIKVRLRSQDLQITISDSGSGIAAHNIPKIFDPFFTTKGEEGTGLGLYITKQVIEQHHGTIDVQSSDRGTTFSINLPV